MENFFLSQRQSVETNEKTQFITKYKPYYIADFKGNEQLISVIKSLIKIDDLNILVTGSGNSGKTSLLYAIIREYYGLSKEDNLPENNIMHINSLKEQGINYYRNEMKTFSQSKSSIFGKKKLVIVDDLDLINEQSQQVFRNHIDKYKTNIHFVSVCSNIHKVIESIQSRLHIIRLKSPHMDTVSNIMDNIIKCEQLQIPPETKKYILTFSKYSIREIISHLEKISILSKIGESVDIEKCKKIISDISYKEFEKYIMLLKDNNVDDAVQILYNIHDYGYSVIDILDKFYAFVKNTDLIDEDKKYNLLPILCKYITYFHNLHEDIIEVVLFTQDFYQSLLI
jgi:DNA polymerase III delta prime subunit